MAHLDPTAQDDLLIFSIGQLILDHMKEDELLSAAISAAESEAMKTLDEIRGVLNDDTLDDPTCFKQIELIVDRLSDRGILTIRHDF